MSMITHIVESQSQYMHLPYYEACSRLLLSGDSSRQPWLAMDVVYSGYLKYHKCCDLFSFSREPCLLIAKPAAIRKAKNN